MLAEIILHMLNQRTCYTLPAMIRRGIIIPGITHNSRFSGDIHSPDSTTRCAHWFVFFVVGYEYFALGIDVCSPEVIR